MSATPTTATNLDARKTLRVAEFSALTGMPGSTVRHHCATGVLPATRLGRTWLIPCSAVDKLVDRAGELADAPAGC